MKSHGYECFTENGKVVYLHRRIWEQKNGPIPEGFHIHHIDGNKENNDISNLECISKGEHSRKTHTGNKYMLGFHHTEETKQKISASHTGKNLSYDHKSKISIASFDDNRLSSRNTTGFRGVSFDKKSNKYRSQIMIMGKYKLIGKYNTAEEASEEYEKERLLARQNPAGEVI